MATFTDKNKTFGCVFIKIIKFKGKLSLTWKKNIVVALALFYCFSKQVLLFLSFAFFFEFSGYFSNFRFPGVLLTSSNKLEVRRDRQSSASGKNMGKQHIIVTWSDNTISFYSGDNVYAPDGYEVGNKVIIPGLILTTYCVRHPHAVPFLRNEMPFSLLKHPKIHAV